MKARLDKASWKYAWLGAAATVTKVLVASIGPDKCVACRGLTNYDECLSERESLL